MPLAVAKQALVTVGWQGGNPLGRHPATPAAGTLVHQPTATYLRCATTPAFPSIFVHHHVHHFVFSCKAPLHAAPLLPFTTGFTCGFGKGLNTIVLLYRLLTTCKYALCIVYG